MKGWSCSPEPAPGSVLRNDEPSSERHRGHEKVEPWYVQGVRLRICATAVFLFVSVAAASVWAAPAGASSSPSRPHYPVPYTFLANIAAGSKGPNTPPPGSNIWTCRPSPAHPHPVILVHGLLANETDNWQTISPLLANHGYCVFSLTYGRNPQFTSPPLDEFGGLRRMQHSALVLGRFVDKVLAATGAHKVDLVGHSEGATMPDWYLKFDGGAAKVARYVGVAPVVHGTDAGAQQQIMTILSVFGYSSSQEEAQLAPVCAACAQFSPSSAFIRRLDAHGVAVPGPRYTQIMTRNDELVLPYTSGVIDAPNSTNIVVQDQCPLDNSDHLAIISDRVAAQDILNALDPGHARPVRCFPTPPVVG